jgi:hypothetical protein
MELVHVNVQQNENHFFHLLENACIHVVDYLSSAAHFCSVVLSDYIWKFHYVWRKAQANAWLV